MSEHEPEDETIIEAWDPVAESTRRYELFRDRMLASLALKSPSAVEESPEQ